MTDIGPMRRAAQFALKHIPQDDRDVAARALVRKYAELIDQADDVESAWGGAFARLTKRLGEEQDLLQDLGTVARALRALSGLQAASDLGPKLLAALTALGMTPAGRPGTVKPEGGSQHGNAVANTLDDLRERRQRRARPNGA